jgi:PIN like domain
VPVGPAAPGRRYKPATVRFYFDADVLGLAHVIAGLRPDVTYPGDPGGVVMKRLRAPCPITSPATKDHVWIPQVAALGWVIVTRDSRIQEHRAEVGAVRDSGARMVALGGNDARGTFDQLEVFMNQWRAITARLDDPGPFIYAATRTTFRKIDITV